MPDAHRHIPSIDSHQHFWAYNDLEYPWMGPGMERLKRDHLPPDLLPKLAAADVHGTVAVQARRTERETEWLLELADLHPFILGVVGWVDFASADLDATLERLAGHARLVGIRELIHDNPDEAYATSVEHVRGVRSVGAHGLACDLLLRPTHLPAATMLVDRFPDYRFVVDHIAKPDMRRGWRQDDPDVQRWAGGIRRLAERPHVACKLSGMVTEADWAAWTPDAIAPFAEVVLEAFGADRVMMGTDWPVCTVAADYGATVELARQLTRRLSPSERTAVFGGTAQRFYGLAEPTAPDNHGIPSLEENA